MADTAISWTDVVWNATTGCDQISAGCDNCYALTMAKRLKGMGAAKYQTDGDPRTSGPGFGVATHPAELAKPLSWRKPRVVFVNSMSDLFHDRVPDSFIAEVFGVMARTPQHTYQVLTKRHGRMRSLLGRASFRDNLAMWGQPWPLPNVWLGVSAENQKWADVRVPALLDTPAAVRFLSCEPLLGPIDLTRIPRPSEQQPDLVWDVLNPRYGVPGRWQAPLSHGIDWVIVGGESGPSYRPMHLSWLTDIVDSAVAAEVPVWVKQDNGRRSEMRGRITDAHWLHQRPAIALAGEQDGGRAHTCVCGHHRNQHQGQNVPADFMPDFRFCSANDECGCTNFEAPGHAEREGGRS